MAAGRRRWASGTSLQRPDHAVRGMAVISVLLVVAIVATLAAVMMGRQAVAIRSAQSEQTRVQANGLLRGELARAQLMLRAEALRDPSTRLDGLWHRPIQGQTIGLVAGEPARVFREITDEQAKFNLHNLVDNGQLDPIETAAFLRLCALLRVPGEHCNRIIHRAAVSLVDAAPPKPRQPEDVQAAQDAADKWGLAQPPTQAQAPRLRVVDDLLAVPGVPAASVVQLQPYVTVLPERTWINGNTASPEVIAAWVPGLSLERARALLHARDGGQWFINRGDFVSRLQMPDIVLNSVRIGISSRWFRVSAALRVPRTLVVVQALVNDNKERLPRIVWLREGA